MSARPKIVFPRKRKRVPPSVIEKISRIQLSDEWDLTSVAGLVSKYEELAMESAVYPNIGGNVVYPTLGMCGEAGEAAEKIKKALRDNDGKLTEEQRLAFLNELGDVAWYITACAREVGSSLAEVLRLNLEKCVGRRERGTIHGSGDVR